MDAERIIEDLDELARRTSDAQGAQRLCWTEGWVIARELLGELLAELELEAETDEAGNLWARLPGRDPELPALAIGSHLDSVPGGGWLDGALGVLAAVGVLREHAAGPPPRRSLVLVDWADEEGARFGRSLFGSSACAGTLAPDGLRGLRDADGRPIAEVLAEHGIELDRINLSRARLKGLGAYLELHIEQGPVLEELGVAAAAVGGCVGVERLRFTFTGETAHAGTTPMRLRRDALLAAAASAIAISEIPGHGEGLDGDGEGSAATHEGLATTGALSVEPGIPTAVAGRASLVADIRHGDGRPLAEMVIAAREACAAAAASHGCDLAEQPVWAVGPTSFDPELVAAARRACETVTGDPGPKMTSGALHDAAAIAPVVPAAMIFVPSVGGRSHAPDEDTDRDDIVAALEAFAATCADALAGLDQRRRPTRP